MSNPPTGVVLAPTVYFIKSPVCKNGEYNTMVLVNVLTSVEAKDIEIDESIIISGKTA